MAVLKAVWANVTYPVLTVCCTQSPLHQAWARTLPNFGSARLQLRWIPVEHNTTWCSTFKEELHSPFVFLSIEQYIWEDFNNVWSNPNPIIVSHTCSSSSSLFFLPSDWFLWGNRKSSAAVGTPGNTATKSCSSGKSDTCDKAAISFVSYHTVTVIITNSVINEKHVTLFCAHEIVQLHQFSQPTYLWK